MIKISPWSFVPNHLAIDTPLERIIITHIIFSGSHHLAASNEDPGHGVSTMNRTSVIDLKSPLERGGPLAVGSVHVQLRQECSVGEKGPPGKKSEPRSLDSSGEGN